MSAAECLPLPKLRGEHKARLVGAPGADKQKRPRLRVHLIGVLSLVRSRHVEIRRSTYYTVATLHAGIL